VCTIGRSMPHAHVAAVSAMARRLGLPVPLGVDVPVAGSGAGVDHRGGATYVKAVHAVVVGDTTLGVDLDVARASTYAAMDWLLERQEAIERWPPNTLLQR
jgi:hypothetical protein